MDKDIKNYYTDLSVLSAGGHTFRLEDCIEVNGHDDSLSYSATLYIDNEKVCNIYNDGWGGMTEIAEVFNQSLLDKAQSDIKGLPWAIYPWEEGMSLMEKLTLSSVMEIADSIAETYTWFVSFIEKKKYKSKLNRVVMGINKAQEIKAIEIKSTANKKSKGAKNTFNEKLDDTKNIFYSKAYCNALIKDGYTIINAPHLNMNEKK